MRRAPRAREIGKNSFYRKLTIYFSREHILSDLPRDKASFRDELSSFPDLFDALP